MDIFVYTVCLGAGVLFTLVSALMGHFLDFGHDAGIDGHVDGSGGHAEAGMDSSDMPGVSAMSPTIISCFVAAFGGLGVIFHEIPYTRNPWVSAPLALIGASGIAAGVLWLVRKIFVEAQASSESKVGAVVGVMADVITPIPANGVGEIAYVQGGSRYTAAAREEEGRPISSGKAVRVIRVVGSQFYVSPA